MRFLRPTRIALVPSGTSGIETPTPSGTEMRRNFPDRFSCPAGGVADHRRLMASRAIVVGFKGSLGVVYAWLRLRNMRPTGATDRIQTAVLPNNHRLRHSYEVPSIRFRPTRGTRPRLPDSLSSTTDLPP